jgi:hypothetical protein
VSKVIVGNKQSLQFGKAQIHAERYTWNMGRVDEAEILTNVQSSSCTKEKKITMLLVGLLR